MNVQVLIKEFRAVPDSAEAALLFSVRQHMPTSFIFSLLCSWQMLQTLDQQQSQIDLSQDDHTSSTRVVEARMAGTAVPAIARPWYSRNVLEYLQRNPNTDKLSLVRIPLVYCHAVTDTSPFRSSILLMDFPGCIPKALPTAICIL
jgi:hypothetical protein